jgi:hypothetical protein
MLPNKESATRLQRRMLPKSVNASLFLKKMMPKLASAQWLLRGMLQRREVELLPWQVFLKLGALLQMMQKDEQQVLACVSNAKDMFQLLWPLAAAWRKQLHWGIFRP